MKTGLLAAKVKADWLESKRRYVALIEQNDLDFDGLPELRPIGARVTRMAINREYLYRVMGNPEEEASPEMIRLRTDSARLRRRVFKAIGELITEHQLKPLRGDFEISKFGSGYAQVIPPRFVVSLPHVADRLRAEGWHEPPERTLHV